MKKVLIFSLAYYPRVGGAEVAIKEITDRIADVEFHMLTMRFSPQDASVERLGNVLVHRVGGGASYFDKILFIPRAALAARRLHTKYAYSGAWAVMSYMLLPLRLAGLGVPYALTLQEGDTEAHMFGRAHILPFLPLLHTGFRKAQVVQAISTYLGGWARKRGFTGVLEIIPNGVDLQKFSVEKAPHEGTLLITSSRLVRKNGVDTVIRALPMLSGVQFVVCGSGPDEHALKALAKELGVEGRVHWRGHVDHADLPRHLGHADIFIRPSRSEGMGNSFVEAFAAGLPVIATREGGLSDFITEEVAWPVEKESPEQIAKQVRTILADPKRAEQVVGRAKQLAHKNYDWEHIAPTMRERVFEKLFV